MSFAKNLKAAMQTANVTQKQLCDLTGLSKSGISQYCGGKVRPTKTTMQVLANALNVSVAFLEEGYTDPVILQSKAQYESTTMSVDEAARYMGVGRQFIREGLKNGSLPFGSAVLFPSGKYRYYISTARFKQFTGIEV